jgi:hypothetical protein
VVGDPGWQGLQVDVVLHHCFNYWPLCLCWPLCPTLPFCLQAAAAVGGGGRAAEAAADALPTPPNFCVSAFGSCRLQLLAGAAAGLQVAGALLGLDLGHPGDTLSQLRALALVRAGLSEEQVRGRWGAIPCHGYNYHIFSIPHSLMPGYLLMLLIGSAVVGGFVRGQLVSVAVGVSVCERGGACPWA